MNKFLTTKDVSIIFKVSEITVRRWINRKWFPAIKIGKMYRIKEEDLKKLEVKR